MKARPQGGRLEAFGGPDTFDIILMDDRRGASIEQRQGVRFEQAIAGLTIGFGLHDGMGHGDLSPVGRHCAITHLKTGTTLGEVHVHPHTSAVKVARDFVNALPPEVHERAIEAEDIAGDGLLACAVWAMERKARYWRVEAERLQAQLDEGRARRRAPKSGGLPR